MLLLLLLFYIPRPERQGSTFESITQAYSLGT